MKATFTIIALVFILSVTAVGSLYFLQPGPAKNGFTRGHIYTVKKLNELELNFGGWYITWLGDTRFYMSNYKAVLALFSCDYNLQDTLYGKLKFADGSRLRLETLKREIIAKLNPGEDSFSSDGFVTLANATGRMVYTYYYKNRFVYLDSDLNVLRSGQLIDTNSVAKIEVGEYREGKYWARTVSAPDEYVNNRGFTDGEYLYNHAGLAGDDESINAFNLREVLDVYRLADGQYCHSLYLPKYKNRKLIDFAVKDDLLIALYERHLVTYQLKGKEVKHAK